ncbi:Mut7-C RNAse domain-containing protein [Ramlibacter sp. USB13]|uniref:Mut7-C RNAse domain-containing protein n=1 Tax=Ramlibacter cellulosilyticus TaxID=2764187 RepID=A0A923MPJ4_9BURK|nr:Mut7-C RNAse domain-containing protein [Ramlibacter cellulosilyticus]MBC5781864.1 Mut7-C RNAse domain-containing protein [Ramlibacter cellulosilyticus]
MTADTRFAADAMLGRLARWLRVLGYDTWYDIAVADPVLVELAQAEARVLLTRDRHLLQELRPVRAHEVRQDDPLQQLRELVLALELPGPRMLFTRCLLDNAALVPVPPEEAEPLLPEGVRGLAATVRRCPACERLYWDGSHVRRMRAALDRVLPGWVQA